MAHGSSDFVTGDDLEDIYFLLEGGFLDDDEIITADIDNIATQVTADEEISVYKCEKCEKICKSKRGLSRHVNVKHPPHQQDNSQNTLQASTTATNTDINSITADDERLFKKLHPLTLKKIVTNAAGKISQNDCYPVSFRENYDKEHFSFSNEDATKLWYTFRKVIDDFNGNAEKFYTGIYGFFVDNVLPTKFEEEYLTNTLLIEAANGILLHLTGNSEHKLDELTTVQSLSENEQKSLQYLAGFVLHKLFMKFYCSKKRKTSIIYEHYASILKACKVDNDSTQTLVNARDRGGLWRANLKMQNIFIHCEKVFRAATAKFTKKIVCSDLVKNVMKDCSVKSNYSAICSTIDETIDKEIQKNLLEHMITIYFRVRTFSFAKDVREKYKADKKKVKSRSLLTSIKIASSSTDLGH